MLLRALVFLALAGHCFFASAQMGSSSSGWMYHTRPDGSVTVYTNQGYVGGWKATPSGNTVTYTPTSNAGTGTPITPTAPSGQTFKPIKKIGDGLVLESPARAPVPGGGTVPVRARMALTGQVLAKTLGRAAMFYNLWEAGSDLFNIWGDYGLSVGPDGLSDASQSSPTLATGYQQSFNGVTYYNAYSYWRARLDYADSQSSNSDYVITSVVENSGGWSAYYTFRVSTGDTFNSSDWTNVVPSSCSAGSYVVNGQCSSSNPSAPLTEQQIIDRIVAGGIPSSAAANALEDAMGIPEARETFAQEVGNLPSSAVDVDITDATGTALSGPQTVGTPRTTTTNTTNSNGESLTTTTTTRTEATTVNNQVTYNNITTTTTVNNTTGQVVTSSETTEPEDTPSPSDTPFNERPDLYEQKYPDGPSAVWDARLAQLKASPLFAAIDGLTPNLGSGGCPQYSLTVDIGFINWGTHSLGPPCYVWDFLKVCMIVTALFAARALIFGG